MVETACKNNNERIDFDSDTIAFMITFLLFIIYMYIKTEECQDVILPEQEFHLLLILHK
jgi:hypothetical protein